MFDAIARRFSQPREQAYGMLLILCFWLLIDRAGVTPFGLVVFQLGLCLVALRFVFSSSAKQLHLPLLGLICIWLALPLIQLLPLPETLLSSISPMRTEVNGWLAPLNVSLANHISLSANATMVSFLRSTTYALVFWLAVWVFKYDDLRERFIKWLVYVGAAFALLGLLQAAFPIPYLPVKGFATFRSPNHAAIFLALLLSFPLQSFLRADHWPQRLRHAVLYLLIAGGCLFCLSRFSLLVVSAVSVVTVLVYFWKNRRADRQVVSQLVLPLVLLISVGVFYLIFVFGIGEVASEWARLSPIELSQGLRLQLWQDSLLAWQQAPLFGFGMGNFETIGAIFRSFSGYIRAAHAENEFLEVMVTAGACGLLVLLFMASSVVRRLRRCLSDPSFHVTIPTFINVLAVIIVLLIAAAVHYFYEATLLGFLAACLMGMLYAGDENKKRFYRFNRLFIVIPLAFFAWANVYTYLHQDRFDRHQCMAEKQFTDTSLPLRPLLQLEQLERCLSWHPMEARFYRDYAATLMAIDSSETVDPQILNYLEAAIHLNGYDAANHSVYAVALMKNGEWSSAQQHFMMALKRGLGAQHKSAGPIYLRLAQLHQKQGHYQETLTMLKHYENISKDSLTAAEVKFQVLLSQNDLVGALEQAVIIVGQEPDRLLRFVDKLSEIELTDQQLKSAINKLILSTADINSALEALGEYIDSALLLKLWDGRLYAYLPDAGIGMRHLQGQRSKAEVSPAKWQEKLNDWIYQYAPEYPASDDFVDYIGYRQTVLFKRPLSLELLVNTSYRPRRQLLANVNGQQMSNTEVVPLGDEWYSLTIALNNPGALDMLAFNTGRISGTYHLSSFRLYPYQPAEESVGLSTK